MQLDKVNETGQAPTDEEVAALEQAVGFKVPEDYLALLKDTQRTYPSLNEFTMADGERESVSFFYSFVDAAEYCRIHILEGHTPPFLPIARALDGFISLDVKSDGPSFGAVYFIDSEFLNANSPTYVAKNVEAFLSLLKPDLKMADILKASQA
jgi:hypothetical protein